MSNKRTQGPGRPDDLPPDAAMAGPPDGGAATCSHGLQLEQLDALERLLGMVAALGDVLATVQAAELADGTVAVIGQAIHHHARAMRCILDQIEAQRLGAPGGRDRVEEARAGYAVAPLRVSGCAVATSADTARAVSGPGYRAICRSAGGAGRLA